MKLIITLLLGSIVAGSAYAHDTTFNGVFIWGAEVESFTPCNGTDDYWVSFDWAGIEMVEYYKEHHTEPYQNMYIEFRGQILNEIVDGFAGQYGGLIRISEVFKYAFEVPETCSTNI